MLWTPLTTTETVFASLVRDLFDRPVMGNAARNLFARHLVLVGLGDGFRRGAAADVERVDGVSIAVRQAAALDADPFATLRQPTFAVDDLGRNDARADLVILAWHGIGNRATADQRDPAQWSFAAVPVGRLPDGRTVDWADLDRLGTTPVPFTALREAARQALTHPVPEAALPTLASRPALAVATAG